MIFASRACSTTLGSLIHELGHAIGFWHEHSRPDRDKYIRILSNNIWPDKLENFQKLPPTQVDMLGTSYDYDSIMHYGPKAFTRNELPTLMVRDTNYPRMIGQRLGLSKTDARQANLLYGCGEWQCVWCLEREGSCSSPSSFSDPLSKYNESPSSAECCQQRWVRACLPHTAAAKASWCRSHGESSLALCMNLSACPVSQHGPCEAMARGVPCMCAYSMCERERSCSHMPAVLQQWVDISFH